jgi:Mce-associated membrane protein
MSERTADSAEQSVLRAHEVEISQEPTTSDVQACPEPGTEDEGVDDRTLRSVILANTTWRRLIAGAAALLMISSLATAAWLYTTMYRPDRRVDAAALDTVVKAATAGTLAVLSYTPQTAPADFAAAKSHLTGDFLAYYDRFSAQVLGPAVQQKGVHTTATVAQAAVSDLTAQSATVLVFVDQTTTSTQNPEPAASASSVRVRLQNAGHQWLISAFDPV